ncbi:hypothetical protein [Streptomyces coeruleofuscus]|uniref:hypothetical protein n=1 Tax=Streptomyces coeruleofuscus TaxID=66879 RepID=UPI0031F844F9
MPVAAPVQATVLPTDTITERGWPPLIWTRADRYRFCTDPAQVEQYMRSAVREKPGEIRRLMTGTVAPQLAAAPKVRWIGYASTMLNTIETNLDMLDTSEH